MPSVGDGGGFSLAREPQPSGQDGIYTLRKAQMRVSQKFYAERCP